MKINFDFGALETAVKKMGAKEKGFVISTRDLSDTLGEGVEVTLDEIDVSDEGVLVYKGEQVLLYIQDHGTKVESTLENGALGNKYHLSFCPALDRMKAIGRFERYVIKNDTSGVFHVSGVKYPSKATLEGNAELKVCKYCLSKLNYNNYNSDKANAFNSFSLEEFFAKYQTRFKHKPSRKAGGKNDAAYTDDWDVVSKAYRESKNWQCEQCKVDLKANKSLLHTHHKDGVKIHNQRTNLSALCVICHSEQPDHHHMKKGIRNYDIHKIISLRSHQKAT